MSNVPPPPPPGPGVPPPPTPGVPPPPPAYGQPAYGQPGTMPYGGYPTAAQPERAGFGIRLGGYLLDGLLYGLLFLPFLIAGFALIAVGLDDCVSVGDEIVCNGREDEGSIAGGIALFVVGGIVVFVVYLRALARSGMTWGRRIVGIKVVRSDNGTAPGWGKAIGRTLFANWISASIFYLGYLWMLWDGEKQTWHDKVAGTYVVKR